MKSPAKKKTAPVKSAKKPAPKPAAKQKAPMRKAPAAKPATGKAAVLATGKPVKRPAKKAGTTSQPKARPAARPLAKAPVKPAGKPVIKAPVKATVTSPKPTVIEKKPAPAKKTVAPKPAPPVRPTTANLRSSVASASSIKTPAQKPTVGRPVVAASAVAPKAAAPKSVTKAKADQPAAKAPSSATFIPVVRKPAAPAPRSKAKASGKPAPKPVKALVELPAMVKPAKKKLSLEIPALLLEGDHTPGAHPGGPGTRYALGLTASPGTGPADELALPESYGTKKIWLVPRDPQWLYAHWDFDDAQQREYNQLSRDGHLLLRVYDAAEVAEAITEIHVHPESRSWFAHVGKGGGRYFAVLGFRDRTGEWNEITRSGPVGTPPDSLSEEVEAEFVTLPYAIESTEPPEAVAAAPTPLPQPVADVPRIETLADVIEVVREYIAGEPALAEAIEEVRASSETRHYVPVELPPPAEFVHWTPAQQQALAQVISMEAVRQVWAGSHPSSVTLAQVSAEQRQKDLASAAAIPAPEAGAPTGPGGGAISSPPGGLPRERSFWFNVNAELIIYGATEPNATVIIGDRAIKLRKDGTFSYRFALPDGLYGLPVSATSADRVETRYASLKFMRETEYGGEVGTHPQDPALKPPGPEHTA